MWMMFAAMLISIHALREEGDRTTAHPFSPARDFYPRPPRGGRLIGLEDDFEICKFLSTPSARRATEVLAETRAAAEDFYPRPPRGGRHLLQSSLYEIMEISIHALREEGDQWLLRRPWRPMHFYPRPPRGGRPGTEGDPLDLAKFLSTPSARRATWRAAIWFTFLSFLSTPSARRATHGSHSPDFPEAISIHALREEGDAADELHTFDHWKFLSTPSARRATYVCARA